MIDLYKLEHDSIRDLELLSLLYDPDISRDSLIAAIAEVEGIHYFISRIEEEKEKEKSNG